MDVQILNNFVSDDVLERLNVECNVEEYPENLATLMYRVISHIYMGDQGERFLQSGITEGDVKSRIVAYFAL